MFNFCKVYCNVRSSNKDIVCKKLVEWDFWIKDRNTNKNVRRRFRSNSAFEVADCDYVVRILESNMADLIWQTYARQSSIQQLQLHDFEKNELKV